MVRFEEAWPLSSRSPRAICAARDSCGARFNEAGTVRSLGSPSKFYQVYDKSSRAAAAPGRIASVEFVHIIQHYVFKGSRLIQITHFL